MEMLKNKIVSENNNIILEGELLLGNMRYFLLQIHKLSKEKGYQDINIDLSKLIGVDSPALLALAANCISYRKEGVDFSLVLPEEERLNKLLLNKNTAHYIDPDNFPKNEKLDFFNYKTRHMPSTLFKDGDEMYKVVNKLLDTVISNLTGIDRQNLTALEWALNEITDNVINHSSSSIGGMIELNNFQTKNVIEFSVCDVGDGIPKTLKTGKPQLRADSDALMESIKEGVTRADWAGQGNGLYGCNRISKLSGGKLTINSGFAFLKSDTIRGNYLLESNSQKLPFNGTLVQAQINYSDPKMLQNALLFKDKIHNPVSFIELKYDENEEGNILFILSEECIDGFGSRFSGKKIRTKLENLSSMYKNKKILINFKDVDVISSSYADETFGKLFKILGPVEFSNKFGFFNISHLVKQLIDRSISQRMAQ